MSADIRDPDLKAEGARVVAPGQLQHQRLHDLAQRRHFDDRGQPVLHERRRSPVYADEVALRLVALVDYAHEKLVTHVILRHEIRRADDSRHGEVRRPDR